MFTSTLCQKTTDPDTLCDKNHQILPVSNIIKIKQFEYLIP